MARGQALWGADLGAVLDLAAPSVCGGCGAPGTRWCPTCDVRLRGAPRPWRPTPAPPGMPRVWAGGPYEGSTRAAIVAWKDQGRHDLTPVLARVLAGVLAATVRGSPGLVSRAAEDRPVIVVPAPSRGSSVRARGWRPTLELARRAAAPAPGLLQVRPVLQVARRVEDQAGLDARSRHRNLSGALAVIPAERTALQGFSCVVVDDVGTTGATLAECARALREAGSGPVVAAVVAATARRTSSSGGALEGPREAD